MAEPRSRRADPADAPERPTLGRPGDPDLGRPERLVDVTLAAGAALLAGAGGLVPDHEVAYELSVGPLPATVGALAGATLYRRRRHPCVVFLVVTALGAGATALHWQSQIPVVLLLAAYALGAFAAVRAGLAAMALALTAFAGLFAAQAPYFDSTLGLFNVALVLAAWVVGLGVAHRGRLAAVARERSRALPHEAADEAERAVVAERLHLARALHTQVTAALEEVAQTAARARSASTPAGPDGIPRSLESIETATRRAAEDLRRLLGTLRAPDPVPEQVHRGPARWPVDVAVAVAVVAFNVSGTLLPDPSSAASHVEPHLPTLLALSVLPGLALLVRRQFPVTALAVVLVVVIAVYGLRWPEGTIPAGLVIACHAVGAWAPGRRAVGAMLALYGVLVLLAGAGPGHLRPDLALVLVVTVPWVIGVMVRRRRLRDQADLEALRAAEEDHAVQLRRAVLDERLAVARDLHDVVSHNLSGIVIQSAAARRGGATGADDDLLQTVEEAARTALRDLQQMVLALSSPATRQPSPGIGQVEDLVARHRRRHGPVTLLLDPRLAQEPESTQLTAYRVVQEGLANAARHAPGASVSVSLAWEPTGGGGAQAAGQVSVEVDNRAGPSASAAAGGGMGLTGLAERVALLGGTLEAGATDELGFRVRALLPSQACTGVAVR